MTFHNGWLQGARRVFSPNYNHRPDAGDISLLVIHNISLPPGEFGNDCIDNLFTNQLDNTAHPYFSILAGVRVSSHFLIDRSGILTQYVSCDDRAWHAGESCFAARTDCNDFSIGIELEGTDNLAYTDVQYTVLAALARRVMAAYPAISVDRIVGHSDIAPARKTDPGPAFDWNRLHQLLAEVVQ